MHADNFFKDKDGNWAIIQKPNILISAWVLLTVINLLFFDFEHLGFNVFSSMVLFTWAYLELAQGISGFRKALGSVVLIAVTLSIITM